MKIRENLKNFEPYEWEESSNEIARKLKINENSIIRFDTNTSPFLPKKWIKNLCMKLNDIKVNEYPDTSYRKLRKLLSKLYKLDMDNILITNGADEGLEIISKTFIESGDNVLLSSPTYLYYKIISIISGANIIEIPRKKNLIDDNKKIIEIGKQKHISVFFFCRPNNPTGNLIKKEVILDLIRKSNSVIVIDEAYADFSSKDNLIYLINTYENLIIVKTFSKAFSLAGARVGYLIGSKKIIQLLNRVRPPNSLSSISLELAEIALKDIKTVKKNIKCIIKERKRCEKFLNLIDGIKVYPTETNFILFKSQKIKSEYLFNVLFKKGLILRNLGKYPGLENCLRFTIQNRKDNNKLLREIYKILNE